MVRYIAVEEAFVTEEIAAEWKKALQDSDCEIGLKAMGNSILAETPQNSALHNRLMDIGPGRIAHMDEAGVDMQVLSLTSPGIQVFKPDIATRLVVQANNILAQSVKSFPKRFAGLGAVAPQDPIAAAKEVARLKSLGLSGIIINSHTFGEYLDLPKFYPLLEAIEAEGLPVYLHPREPSSAMIAPYLDYGLYFAGWGFAAETSLHAMRMIMSGVFERFPKLKIILGHMGEGIPFWLQRIDNRYLLQVKIGAVQKMKYLPSEYFLENFYITTAGVTSMPALRLSLDVLGVERIMFAADYPYEDDADAVNFIKNAEITKEERELIAGRNAERIFGIK